MKITSIDDLREGDVVTYAFVGHEVTGKAWFSKGSKSLMVGGAQVGWMRGPNYSFVSAVRNDGLHLDDEAALKHSAQDLSDIDPATLDRLKGRFNNAYATAARVVSGEVDPLTV